MLIEHRIVLGRGSFLIFPQLRLPWNLRKSKDRRSDIPDLGLGRFTEAGTVSLQGGVEQKPAIMTIMRDLPPSSAIRELNQFRSTLNFASIQAEDQIKAGVKNGCLSRNTAIKWIIAAGPYFIIRAIGPFTGNELTTRGHKPNPSGDAVLSAMIQDMKDNANEMPILESPYLVGTEAAAFAVHAYLSSGAALYHSTDWEALNITVCPFKFCKLL